MELTKTDSNINIRIIDHGEGIPADQLPYIWERFYKVVHASKRGQSGTGLAMAIVKEILEMHNYTYGIESEVGKAHKHGLISISNRK